MPLMNGYGLAKSYGSEDIFDHIDISIPHRARIGLVGANGVGKTTLLRLLLGVEEPTSGKVQRARGVRIGYLPQEAQLHSSRTVWQECLTVFADLLQMQSDLHQMEVKISQAGQPDELLAVYGKLQHRFEHQGGYTYENRIRLTLTGLGFSPVDFNRPIEQLSGGQKTRILLAQLLLTDPDLLLLDEPTNHLDIQAIEWLEGYLREWSGAAVIVSHDRYFLDQVVDTIWEMTPALDIYRGNYSAYLQQREEHYQRALLEYQEQLEFIEKEEDYIRRNIAGQNTRQAQGRRKRLESLLESARLAPPSRQRRLSFQFGEVSRSGDLVLQTRQLAVGYEDEGRPLFQAPDIVLKRGECAAVMGPNGAGKTTFLKTILGQIAPYAGEVILGASLQVGYFAQAHEMLNASNTLMEEIEQAAPAMRQGEIRDYLAKYLFTGDDVFKTVSVLSGGERGRLALAVLALSAANLLLLDEPTNHLDLVSQEILQSVLAAYPGTILLVSHDRYLIDALATQIWEVVPGKRVLEVFEGTYSEYKLKREQEEAAKSASQGLEKDSDLARLRKIGQAAQKEDLSRSASRSNNKERARIQRIQFVEEQINELEGRLRSISLSLENPPADAVKVMRLSQDYQSVQKELEERFAEWEKLHTAGDE